MAWYVAVAPQINASRLEVSLAEQTVRQAPDGRRRGKDQYFAK